MLNGRFNENHAKGVADLHASIAQQKFLCFSSDVFFFVRSFQQFFFFLFFLNFFYSGSFFRELLLVVVVLLYCFAFIVNPLKMFYIYFIVKQYIVVTTQNFNTLSTLFHKMNVPVCCSYSLSPLSSLYMCSNEQFIGCSDKVTMSTKTTYNFLFSVLYNFQYIINQFTKERYRTKYELSLGVGMSDKWLTYAFQKISFFPLHIAISYIFFLIHLYTYVRSGFSFTHHTYKNKKRF